MILPLYPILSDIDGNNYKLINKPIVFEDGEIGNKNSIKNDMVKLIHQNLIQAIFMNI